MAIAFSCIAKHRQYSSYSMHLSTNTFQETGDFFPSALQDRQTLFSLVLGKKIFGYIVGYIAIAEVKAKHFN